MPLHRSGLVSRHALAHPEEPQQEPLPYERVLKYNPNHGPDGRFASSGGGRRGGTAGPPTEDAFGRSLRGRERRNSEAGRRNAVDIARAVGPRASSADIAADKGKWTPGKSFAEHQAGQFAPRPAVAPYTIPDTSNDKTPYSITDVSGDTGFSRGGTPVKDPYFNRGSDTPVHDPHFNRELPKTPHGMRAATIPPAITGGLSNRAYREEEARQVAELKARGVLDASGRPAEHPRSSSGKFHVENPAGPNFQFSNEQRRRHAKEMFGSVGERAETYRQSGKLPVGTIHYSDQTLIPTGKKGVSPARNPVGTIYSSDQTLVPSGKGTYIDKATGQIYRSNAVNSKAQLARDAAKQAAYVAAYGKKNKVGRR